MRIRIIALTAGLALIGGLLPGAPASAAPTTFKNCTAMHKVYKNGLAKTSFMAKHPKPASVKIKTAKVSKTLYLKNQSMDRDKDGIACEVGR